MWQGKKTFTRESLKSELRAISMRGFIRSHKDTSTTRNDGAPGNLLENLLGIDENNLPIADADGWELKTQRATTGSLLTLKHIEPYPRELKFVPNILLPNYGWPHKEAGAKYLHSEKSFRMTMNGGTYTDRGFKVRNDGDALRIVFSPENVDQKHSDWLKEILLHHPGGQFEIQPFWKLADLEKLISPKLTNMFYVTANVRRVNGQEEFHYVKCQELMGFSMTGFLDCLQEGIAFVEFDARTGHNHGTKFRIKQSALPLLYSHHEVVFDN